MAPSGFKTAMRWVFLFFAFSLCFGEGDLYDHD